MKPSDKFYRGCYYLARTAFAIFYRLRVTGKENIPEDAVLVCANHSSNADPFLIAFAFGIDCQMHIIAKAELFKIPVISPVLKRLGMISVDRATLDVMTIKKTLTYLKSGEKVVIFPEGTRAHEDGEAYAKSGAIKLAERAGVPLLPVFLPRKKPLFTRVPIIIGEPYNVDRSDSKRSPEEYERLSGALMGRIKDLDPSAVSDAGSMC